MEVGVEEAGLHKTRKEGLEIGIVTIVEPTILPAGIGAIGVGSQGKEVGEEEVEVKVVEDTEVVEGDIEVVGEDMIEEVEGEVMIVAMIAESAMWVTCLF